MRTRGVIVSPVMTVGENDTIRDLVKFLVAKRVSAVPVLDHIGTLMEADLLHRVEVNLLQDDGFSDHRRRGLELLAYRVPGDLTLTERGIVG